MVLKGKIISGSLKCSTKVLVSVSCLFGLTSSALALGLGDLRVKSALGQPLMVHANVVGSDSELLNPTCLRARVVTVDGIFISSATITIHQNAKQRALAFSTRQPINEPAINLIIDIQCETQLHREFSILLDPPEAMIGGAVLNRDESPLAGTAQIPVTALGNAMSSRTSDAPAKAAPKKKKKSADAGAQNLAGEQVLLQAPDQGRKAESKSKKSGIAVHKDVLKLSDDIESPIVSQGLRMSDVLSSEAGQRLLENTQELRAAQARMAAILRDEAPNLAPISGAAQETKVDESKEIATLRQETEQLRKQNLLDKSALAKMQDKSGFDYWLATLAVIATLSIGVILFLLMYIRRNLSGKNDSWWDGEEDALSSQPERIEDVINNLQSSYDTKAQTATAPSGALTKKSSPSASNEAEKVGAADVSPSQALFENSSFHRTPSLEETNSSIFNFFAPRGNSVKVEEISDVTQEAEFWISMNDPQRAIEILSAQEQLEQPDSPVPWLFLLDLYRTVNDRQKYDLLRDRFIVFFNANIPEFDTDLSQVPSRQLEDFPHLIQKICDNWGRNGIVAYLEGLLVDDREGKRAGFDLPVYRDILMLLGIAHELEKIMAAEGPLKDTPVEVPVSEPELKEVPADHLAAAEFGTIEFESIDFPIFDRNKKSGS